jgi:hypothetical protein
MASFLDDTKTFGIVGIILGVIMIVSGVLGFITKDPYYAASAGIVIYGLLVALLGIGVYKGQVVAQIGNVFSEGVNTKFGVLTAYIGVVGVGYLVMGICCIVQAVLTSNYGFGSGVVDIIFAAIVLYVAYTFKDGKQTTMDKVFFILLAIAFIVLAIAGFIGGIGSLLSNAAILDVIVGFVQGICLALLFVMLFLYLISPEVKSKLGM